MIESGSIPIKLYLQKRGRLDLAHELQFGDLCGSGLVSLRTLGRVSWWGRGQKQDC